MGGLKINGDVPEWLREEARSIRVECSQREPVKFEAGQVVRLQSLSPMVVCGQRGLLIEFNYLELNDTWYSYHVDWCAKHATPLSPAPRIGDTWASGESVARITADGDRLRIVSEGEPFVGDVVVVARRLWEGGYRRVAHAVQPENANVTCAGVAGLRTFRWSPDSAGRPSVSLDDPKALVPTHGEAKRGMSFEERAKPVDAAAFWSSFKRIDIGKNELGIRDDALTAFARERCGLERLPNEEDDALRRRVDAAMRPFESKRTRIAWLDSAAVWDSVEPAAYVADTVYGSMEAIERLRKIDEDIERAVLGANPHASALPRAGEYWENETTAVLLIECPQGLHTSIVATPEVSPLQHVGDASATAEFLREHGYRRTTERARMTSQNAPRYRLAPSEYPGICTLVQERVDATTPRSPLDGLVISSPNAAQWTTSAPASQIIDDIKTMAHEQAQKWIDRGVLKRPNHFDCRVRCTDLLDSTRVYRATGDDLRKLGEMYGVPELRAGMVVRESLKDYPDGARIFGVVQGATRSNVSVLWTGFVAACSYSLQDAATWIGDGRWRIVEPNVAPLASLANAVAAIFAQPDRATSRRYVDIACAQLRGEPFAAAIRAVLVAGSELSDGAPYDRSPFEVALLIAGAREHERQRSRIAPGARSLSDAQLREVVNETVVSDRDVTWTTRHARVYERARAGC